MTDKELQQLAREIATENYKHFGEENSIDLMARLQKKAVERLAGCDEDESITGQSMHPEVRKHMESIVNGEVPFGYVIIDD